jgi:hypothetical protein
MRGRVNFLICVLFINAYLYSEPVRVQVEGNLVVGLDNPAGGSVPLSYVGSAVVRLGDDLRFLRAVELSLTVPQMYLAYRGSLAVIVYTDLDKAPASGIADVEGQRLAFDPHLNKIQTIYQIPLREGHGLRTTPYVTLLGYVPPSSFPILFRIMPVIKGLSESIEGMKFSLAAKPVLSNEGALSLSFRYPDQLQGKPFTVLIDDEPVGNIGEQRLLKEGEHHLIVLSEDFRNENRRFLIERGKTLSLTVELQDPTPLVYFEAPEKTAIYFDNVLVNAANPLLAEPGQHEVKFLLSDYSIIRPIVLQKGKTYKIAMNVDVHVSESE